MKNLIITKKTKVVKNEIENYQKILEKYRKQKRKAYEQLKEYKNKREDLAHNYKSIEYKQAAENYRKTEKKITKIDFFINTCKTYRKSWLELYAFNILKDNKDVITQPLYYKREQARLLEHFDFNGLRFEVYHSGYLNYHNGLVMFENYDKYESEELLNEKYLEDLSLMEDKTLRYRWQQRYLHFENFEKFTNEKYKQIIKIAKKSQKYIDTITEEVEKLGDHFKYEVAGLVLDSYVKDWQKYERF